MTPTENETSPPLKIIIIYPCCGNRRSIDMRHSRLLIGDRGLYVPAGILETCSACYRHHYEKALLPYYDPEAQAPRPKPRPRVALHPLKEVLHVSPIDR